MRDLRGWIMNGSGGMCGVWACWTARRCWSSALMLRRVCGEKDMDIRLGMGFGELEAGEDCRGCEEWDLGSEGDGWFGEEIDCFGDCCGEGTDCCAEADCSEIEDRFSFDDIFPLFSSFNHRLRFRVCWG